MSINEPTTITLSDGRTQQIFLDDRAPEDSALLVYHHGTPAAGPMDPDFIETAREHGFRMLEIVRPGYGLTTRQLGRTVADVAPLVAEIADLFGHERFVSIGWSGGGPHTLATAALLPDRCVATLCIAGVAPWNAEGLDFMAGMGQDNIIEFGAALEGEKQLIDFLTPAAEGLSKATGAEIIAELDSLLPEADRAVLSAGRAEAFAATFRWAVSSGIAGWYDDDRAFLADWGFAPESITVPTFVYQGSDDLMVPFAHGQWLAAHLPTSTATLVEGEGHLSIDAYLSEGLTAARALLA